MNIIESNLKFKNELILRPRTDYIVIHHIDAKNASVQDIHNWHLNNGWSGIGYHYYVRKDGTVYTGRPNWTIGAQVANKNSVSLGVAFEGDFEKYDTSLTAAQLQSGAELLRKIQKDYSEAKIVKHNYFGGTTCPGKNFPFDTLVQAVSEVDNESLLNILKTLAGRIQLDIAYWHSNAQPNKTINGENVATLLKRMKGAGLI